MDKQTKPILAMQANDLMFFRRFLGMEKIPAELVKPRQEYIYSVLIPALKSIDEQIRAIREELAVRNPDGTIKANEDGSYAYGDNQIIANERKEGILSQIISIQIEDIDKFTLMKNIFINTKQELNEYEGYFYIQICDALNTII